MREVLLSETLKKLIICTTVVVYGFCSRLQTAETENVAEASYVSAAPLANQEYNYVNVKKFGAKGDGVTDDYTCILNAINSVKNTSKVLYFPNGDYYCSKKILLYGNCNIKGESKEGTYITFRDDTSNADYDEWAQRGLVTFNGDSLSMSCISFRYIADITTKYTRTKTQTGAEASEGVLFSVIGGNGIKIEDCNFLVGGTINPSITCMWLKAEQTSIVNTVIKGCRFENFTNATVGGCLWVSSHDKPDSVLANISITDSEFIKHANDEALAIWGHNASNILVKNNLIKYSGQEVQNDVLVSFGMPNPNRVEKLQNIQFVNNTINIEGKCIAGVKFQLLSDDSYILFAGNNINADISKKTTFKCIGLKKAGQVDFSNNTVNIKGGKNVSFISKNNENITMNDNSFNKKR